MVNVLFFPWPADIDAWFLDAAVTWIWTAAVQRRKVRDALEIRVAGDAEEIRIH